MVSKTALYYAPKKVLSKCKLLPCTLRDRQLSRGSGDLRSGWHRHWWKLSKVTHFLHFSRNSWSAAGELGLCSSNSSVQTGFSRHLETSGSCLRNSSSALQFGHFSASIPCPTSPFLPSLVIFFRLYLQWEQLCSFLVGLSQNMIARGNAASTYCFVRNLCPAFPVWEQLDKAL